MEFKRLYHIVTVPATPLAEAQQAGHFFGYTMKKIPFSKPALSISEQIDFLKEKGMVLSNIAFAEHKLQTIGYFRLSGYWKPFQYFDATQNKKMFSSGTTFEKVVSRYDFDNELRILIIRVLEKIEIASRIAISNHMSLKYGPHWHTNNNNFAGSINFGNQIRHERAQFIKHYKSKYTPIMPPSWMVFEILSFGSISVVYSKLHDDDKKQIAKNFNLPKERLQSWLHSLTFLRNLCAHHNRILYMNFIKLPSVPKEIPKKDRKEINLLRRFYRHAIAIQVFEKQIPTVPDWFTQIDALLNKYPQVPQESLGFPTNWKQQKIWK